MKSQPWCPVTFTAAMFAGKWKPLILLELKEGPRRFGELRRLIPDVTQRSLSMQLRALEKDGLVLREEKPAAVLHVEYRLTDRAMTLGPILDAMTAWGMANADDTKSTTVRSGARLA